MRLAQRSHPSYLIVRAGKCAHRETLMGRKGGHWPTFVPQAQKDQHEGGKGGEGETRDPPCPTMCHSVSVSVNVRLHVFDNLLAVLDNLTQLIVR